MNNGEWTGSGKWQEVQDTVIEVRPVLKSKAGSQSAAIGQHSAANSTLSLIRKCSAWTLLGSSLSSL